MILILLPAALCQGSSAGDHYHSWKVYRGDPGSSGYSQLDQINRSNVAQLEVAWVYNSGDPRNAGSQANPIIVDGVMYLTTPGIKVAALNAATGELKWIFDPFDGKEPSFVNRGVMHWQEGEDKRIFVTAGASLHALDAETGVPVPGFGKDGVVDLRQGLYRDPNPLSVRATSPGVVHRNLLIIGSSVNEREGSAPGHIRAYNTKTGKIEWTFRTIPFPGEFGYETWGPDAWQLAGGANNWGGMSLDEEREIVYIPTGSPAPDFFSPGTRGDGENLFGNTILALDANTGERIWHYQIVRHDLWDYDLSSPPLLVQVERDGRKVDAVVQVTKHGFTFVLDRDTGESLFPVEERPVPRSDIEGEQAWPTQLFPLLPEPFTRQHITEDDLTDISPEAREYAVRRFRELRYEGLFTPVGLRETFVYPGSLGGSNWGGASFDPETNILYVNANEYGVTHRLKKIEVPSVNEESGIVRGHAIYQANCASCHSTPGGREPSEFPSLTNIEERYGQSQVLSLIESGRGIMPPFPHLSAEEKEAIVAYLFNVADYRAIESSAETSGQGDGSPTAYRHTIDFVHQHFRDQDGYYATKPPWGTLNAINLNTGKIVWKVPLGEYEELTARGIPVTGTLNLGGSIVTAGGLVFIGATHDEKFRAFDKETGEILWEYDLPAVGYAVPATYEIDGKQYVVIAATGGSRLGIRKSDAFIAFALPDRN